MIESRQMLARGDNYGGTRPMEDLWLTYHYTGNKTDTASANAKYFQTGFRDASAHYFVDEKEIVQSVPDNYVAWSVGSTGWLDQASPYASKGHKYWGIARNLNTLNIEMCSVNGKHTKKILDNAKALGQALCELYDIPNARVIRHFDVNGKLCPITMVTDEAGWNKFKADIGCDVQKGKKPLPYIPPKDKLVVDGLFGRLSTIKAQKWMGVFADGVVSGQNMNVYKYQANLISAIYDDGGSPFVKALQTYLNEHKYSAGEVDGYMGQHTVSSLQRFLKKQGYDCGTPDGFFGEKTATAFQEFLNSF